MPVKHVEVRLVRPPVLIRHGPAGLRSGSWDLGVFAVAAAFSHGSPSPVAPPRTSPSIRSLAGEFFPARTADEHLRGGYVSATSTRARVPHRLSRTRVTDR